MSFTVSGSSDFEQPPVGTFLAICYKLIDIGTQHGEYQGQPTARRQVVIGWELPSELMADGQPFVVSQFYTASLNEKAKLRHDLEAWRGRAFTEEEMKGFDLRSIAGKPCMLSLIDKAGKTRVGGVMKLPKGMPVPKAVNANILFSVDEWDQKVFESFSPKFQSLIEASDEAAKRCDAGGFRDMPDDAPWADEDVTF